MMLTIMYSPTVTDTSKRLAEEAYTSLDKLVVSLKTRKDQEQLSL